jgi:predicted NBD/HSP70 family sugar kinase
MNSTSIDKALAVDIGGTSMKLAVVNKDGDLLTEIKSEGIVFDDKHCGDLQKISDAIQAYVRQLPDALRNLTGIGVSFCVWLIRKAVS